jgi:hypothetical protein
MCNGIQAHIHIHNTHARAHTHTHKHTHIHATHQEANGEEAESLGAWAGVAGVHTGQALQCVYACMCENMFVCVCVCARVCVYVCAFTRGV